VYPDADRVTPMAQPNLLFIDTNILLDFYRPGNETGLQLLSRVEKIANKLIITYQLESEFKKNRQTVIQDSWRELKGPTQISRLGIFSDAKATRVMAKNLKEADKRVKQLRARLIKALENPTQHDPVYKVCQRFFQKADDLTLTRDNPVRRAIRRSAYRRLLHGCPPGKRGDTSYGDAFNWEWMVNCAITKKAGLVIVSRDADYGVTIGDKSYVNDHLRHEFSDKVSRKRKLALFSRLSEALKTFDIPVSAKEEQVEKDFVTRAVFRPIAGNFYRYGDFADVRDRYRWSDAQRAYDSTVSNNSSLELLDMLKPRESRLLQIEPDEKKES
jgi:hypothetical protein